MGSPFTDRFDGPIEAAVCRWWPDWPFPTWLKAQLWQESRLDPNAESSAGAVGIGQFLPGTWRDVSRALRWGVIDRRLAEPGIEAAAYYMHRQRAEWRSPRPALDRHNLALASYNAGLGHLLEAQRRCRGAALYRGIIACLPAVTGPANARQTTDYVDRIARWRAMMEAGR